jgi:MFS family permease
VYGVTAGLFVCAVLFTGMIPKVYPAAQQAGVTMLQNIGAGLRYIKNQPLIMMLILQGVAVALLSMPFRSLIQVYAKDVYGSDPSQVGLLLVASGIGGLIGAMGIATLRAGQRRGWVLLGSAVLSGAALVLISTVPLYIVGFAAMIGIGLGESGRWALGQALIMEESDDEFRGRVMSVMMMTFGLMPLGVYPLAAAMDLFDPQPAVLGMAVILLGVSVLFFVFQPRLRRIP